MATLQTEEFKLLVNDTVQEVSSLIQPQGFQATVYKLDACTGVEMCLLGSAYPSCWQ